MVLSAWPEESWTRPALEPPPEAFSLIYVRPIVVTL